MMITRHRRSVQAALGAALLFAACDGGPGSTPGVPEDASSFDARDSDGQADDLIVRSPPLATPFIVTEGDALRPVREGDRLALLTVDSGGTLCLANPWMGECIVRVRVVGLPDATPLFSSEDANAGSVPGLSEGTLFWTAEDGRLRLHRPGGLGVESPLADDPDLYGIQGPVVVQDRGVFWYASSYTTGSQAFRRWDLDSGALLQVTAAQHDWPWFLSDLGAPPLPQFDVEGQRIVWVHYQPYGNGQQYRILLHEPGAVAPEVLPTGDVSCLWPRLRAPWVYYVWFQQDHWQCTQLQCIFHVARVHLETGAVEQLDDPGARVTGLYPPIPWSGGVAWLDFREGPYQVVVRPEGMDPSVAAPGSPPVGLYTGVTLTDREEGGLELLWSALHEDHLQVFRATWPLEP
ncbi:MAG: hypothetical protein FJ098_07475 [Deltaproteobacteria bacterium]|nr:hypothetical protein [Deltaproteobacteria bacterium]